MHAEEIAKLAATSCENLVNTFFTFVSFCIARGPTRATLRAVNVGLKAALIVDLKEQCPLRVLHDRQGKHVGALK